MTGSREGHTFEVGEEVVVATFNYGHSMTCPVRISSPCAVWKRYKNGNLVLEPGGAQFDSWGHSRASGSYNWQQLLLTSDPKLAEYRQAHLLWRLRRDVRRAVNDADKLTAEQCAAILSIVDPDSHGVPSA